MTRRQRKEAALIAALFALLALLGALDEREPDTINLTAADCQAADARCYP